MDSGAGPLPPCGAGSGTDSISGLPDELLHEILGRLFSTTAAARTSVLSRRWRRVWANLPELVLGDDLVDHGASLLDAIDGSLAGYSAAHVQGLKITVPSDTPAHRIASWLRFASRRLSGALYLHVRPAESQADRLADQWKPREDNELVLPPCEGATSIELVLRKYVFVRPQPPSLDGVTFTALTDLEIRQATTDGGTLGALVSTQCPRLRKLSLRFLTLVTASDVSIRSGSLQHLKFDVQNTLRLDLATPALQVLDIKCHSTDVYVAAPSLAEFEVWGEYAQFVITDAGRHLRRLEVTRGSAMAALVRQFDSVDELRLRNPTLAQWGKTFLDDTNEYLPKCRTLWLCSIWEDHHGFAPTVLHLLRSANGVKKLLLLYLPYPSPINECASTCFCRLPEGDMIMMDGTIPDSLEEIEIEFCGGSADLLVEFLTQLLPNIWGSTSKLKSVEIIMSCSASSLSDVVYERVRDMCLSNISITWNVFPNGKSSEI